MKLSEIKTHRLESPPRRAIPAGHARPGILMKIDKDIEPVFARFGADRGKVIQIGRIKASRPCMFDRFPGGQKPNAIKAPGRQTREVFGRGLVPIGKP